MRALVLSGAGLNCERETAAALQLAGFRSEIVHIVDLIAAPEKLKRAQLLALVGGFSYGDHMGAALVLAEQMRRLGDALQDFIARDTLILGICNGCQLLLRLELLANAKWAFRANQKRPLRMPLGARPCPPRHTLHPQRPNHRHPCSPRRRPTLRRRPPANQPRLLRPTRKRQHKANTPSTPTAPKPTLPPSAPTRAASSPSCPTPNAPSSPGNTPKPSSHKPPPLNHPLSTIHYQLLIIHY